MAVSLLLAGTMITPAFAVSGTVNTEGSSLRVRSQADTTGSVLAQLPHGTTVEVLSSVENGWYQIHVDNTTGYVSGDYLLVDAAEAASLPVEAEPTYIQVTVSVLNVRSGPGTDYDKVGTVRSGQVLQAVEENGWYKVDSGYVSAEYVKEVDASAASQAGKGQEIANYALQFVGYPYVYGGSSPKGFDCSGLVSYCFQSFGYSTNRTAATLYSNGTAVEKSDLQPGDAVFFRSDGSSTISHVGLYIGNGEMIHASSSAGKVIITNIEDSGYYTRNYVGARRIAG